MANDSTELTFVRCPSCRSLVPAMSSRCRMCGATLDAVGKSSTPPPADSSKQGRVRQRTMSSPSDPVGSSADEGEKAAEPQAAAKGHSAANNPAANHPAAEIALDDPLDAFVEEVPVDALEPSNGEHSHESPVETKNPFVAKPGRDEGERPQVVVEHGREKRGGLSFGKSAASEESSAAVSAKPKHEPKPEPVAQESRREERKEDRSEERHGREDRSSRERSEQRDNRDRSREEAQQKAPQKSFEGPRVHAPTQKQDGRLFGWLVSYDDPNGSAIELREGRFFICGSKLKDNDLVLDDASLSTPHAMVRISADQGFEVQDLMSEKGVHMRRREGDAYRREDDRIRVNHGDWIKFGECEYLVSLIAHVGKK